MSLTFNTMKYEVGSSNLTPNLLFSHKLLDVTTHNQNHCLLRNYVSVASIISLVKTN